MAQKIILGSLQISQKVFQQEVAGILAPLRIVLADDLAIGSVAVDGTIQDVVAARAINPVRADDPIVDIGFMQQTLHRELDGRQ